MRDWYILLPQNESEKSYEFQNQNYKFYVKNVVEYLFLCSQMPDGSAGGGVDGMVVWGQ